MFQGEKPTSRMDGAKWHEVAENGTSAAEWRSGGVRLTLPLIAADFYNNVSVK